MDSLGICEKHSTQCSHSSLLATAESTSGNCRMVSQALPLKGYLIVRTPHALDQWDSGGLECIRDLVFKAEWGTEQSDIHSPFTWLAVLDVLVCMLEYTPKHHSRLRNHHGTMCAVRGLRVSSYLSNHSTT